MSPVLSQCVVIYEAKFAVKQRVCIDGCHDLVGTITAIMFKASNVPVYEVGWIANGVPQSVWIDEYRLQELAT